MHARVPHRGDSEEEQSPSKIQRHKSPQRYEDHSCQQMVDNSENILKVLKNLFIEKEMCDVQLKVGNKYFGSHKLILCASSDVFQAMLMKPEWTEWHESKIELQEMPGCEKVFGVFLEYFYTGKILITHTNVMPILALADKYIVKGLSRLCLKYMCQDVPHAAFHNQLFSWLQYAVFCGHTKVAQTCQNYIKWNFESVANTPDFSNFDPEMLILILKQTDIVVYNEMVLYNCVVRWLDLQRIRLLQQHEGDVAEVDRQMTHLVETIMIYIRFPMMTPRELADLLLSPIIKQHKEFFVDRMAIGMSFHSGYKDRIEMLSRTNEGRLLFIPRLYTSDSYCAMLAIENFKSTPSYHTSTFVFSSHTSAAECESEKINEWVVDLYPKGVWFKRCLLIGWQGTLEVPEDIISTVRLSLTCREMTENTMRLKVSVLIYGIQGGVEHIMEVRETICHFSCDNRVVNIDNIIPFHELNPTLTNDNNSENKNGCAFLIGPERNQLKLNVVITPC